MLIDCPRCGTRYRIAGGKLRPEGSKLKCTRCGNIFLGSLHDAHSEEDEESGARSGAGSVGMWEGLGEEDPGRAHRKGRRWLWLLILFFLLAAAAGGYLLSSGMTLRLPFLQEPSKSAEGELERRPAGSEAVQDIRLRDVDQYMVRNKHMGSLLVVEGQAENESGGPKTRIELEVTVFDEQGEKLQSKTFFCGNTLSLERLQSFRRDELESAFQSDLARLSQTKRVDAGEAVPFMGVIYSPPEDMAEFGLEVLRASVPEES